MGRADVMATAGDSRWGPTRKPHHRNEEDKGWHPKPPLPRLMPEPRLAGALSDSRLVAADAPTLTAARSGELLLPPHPWLTNWEHRSCIGLLLLGSIGSLAHPTYTTGESEILDGVPDLFGPGSGIGFNWRSGLGWVTSGMGCFSWYRSIGIKT
ncbi:hypothetical protein Scep_014183 [Stephania cephalantha]|uniref:Uncharacterized protein n=1 Tax=Stephania cephalantha TaxID=152367 RepID=A0AAP0J0G4_9MAGN